MKVRWPLARNAATGELKMTHLLKELRTIMSQFLDTIEAKISAIHATPGADPATVTAQVMAEITPQITDMQNQITELQTALTDTVNHLNAGDADAALATATAAAPASDTSADDTPADASAN
jgi:hypothetical protein